MKHFRFEYLKPTNWKTKKLLSHIFENRFRNRLIIVDILISTKLQFLEWWRQATNLFLIHGKPRIVHALPPVETWRLHDLLEKAFYTLAFASNAQIPE